MLENESYQILIPIVLLSIAFILYSVISKKLRKRFEKKLELMPRPITFEYFFKSGLPDSNDKGTLSVLDSSGKRYFINLNDHSTEFVQTLADNATNLKHGQVIM